MTLHFMNDVDDIGNYVIIASLKIKPIGKLIHRMSGLRLLIPSLPAEPRNSLSFLKVSKGAKVRNRYIKYHT